MARTLTKSVTLALALLSATGALAQTPQAPPAAAPQPLPPAAAQLVGGFREEFLRQLAELEEKMVSLARATPAETFGWRPGEGVRSVGEVYAHVAATNFLIPRAWGAQPAAGVDVRALQQSPPGKAELIAILDRSFDYLRDQAEETSVVELERQFELFGRRTTLRDGFFTVATHMHEHLGQSIAYARINGVVPPWSAGTAALH